MAIYNFTDIVHQLSKIYQRLKMFYTRYLETIREPVREAPGLLCLNLDQNLKIAPLPRHDHEISAV
jgi:hypothetical protein